MALWQSSTHCGQIDNANQLMNFVISPLQTLQLFQLLVPSASFCLIDFFVITYVHESFEAKLIE